MSCHEPLNSGRNVSDRINPERERKKSDEVRSGILTEMCPEHFKTHIHLNLTRLPDYAAVRSEIETFLEALQSSSNPDVARELTVPGESQRLFATSLLPWSSLSAPYLDEMSGAGLAYVFSVVGKRTTAYTLLTWSYVEAITFDDDQAAGEIDLPFFVPVCLLACARVWQVVWQRSHTDSNRCSILRVRKNLCSRVPVRMCLQLKRTSRYTNSGHS